MKLSEETKVSLVAAVCILALAIISKNVLHVQLDFVSLYGPIWILMAYIATKGESKKSKCGTPLFWSLMMILVTSAILVVYAL